MSGKVIFWSFGVDLLNIEVISVGIPKSPVSNGRSGFFIRCKFSEKIPSIPDVRKQ